MVLLSANETEPIVVVMPLHFAAFFVIGAILHGQLAADRPPITHLTEFYLWIAVGGVLGGSFTAFVAPRVFTSVAEYPLAVVLACLLAPLTARNEDGWRPRALDVVLPAALGHLVASALAARRGGALSGLSPLLAFGLPALLCLSFGARPVRLGLGAAAILLASGINPQASDRAIHVERSFFGIHRVEADASNRFHTLYHGTTVHGMQNLDPAHRREPLIYYHATGPIGQVLGTISTPIARMPCRCTCSRARPSISTWPS